jgi:hypothetical protein
MHLPAFSARKLALLLKGGHDVWRQDAGLEEVVQETKPF